MSEKATFGAGCFWKPDHEFFKIDGIIKTTVGYMGGNVEEPSYELVCTDTTGHAEVVQIEFDPKKVSYKELLDVFWKIHDPTQIDRQGPDVGKQYRSVIFYHNGEQKKAAEKSLKEELKKHDKKIATAIVEAEEFYRAEEYHQKYYQKKGIN